MRKLILLFLFSFTSLFAFEHLSPQNIDEKLKNKNAIVDFYADWCPPCKVLAKNLIEFDKVKSSDVVIYKVDIEEYRDLANKYKIRSLPSLLYIKNGQIRGKEIGIKSVKELQQNTKKYF